LSKIHHLPSLYCQTLPAAPNLSKDPIHSFNYDGIFIISEKICTASSQKCAECPEKNMNGINITEAFGTVPILLREVDGLSALHHDIDCR